MNHKRSATLVLKALVCFSALLQPVVLAISTSEPGLYPHSISAESIAIEDDFDRVTINNHVFMKNEKEFHFIGFNQYYMLEKAMNERNLVEETLADAKALGMNVMRTWAFDDRPNGLQTSPGVFNEEYFKALDYVIDSSSKHGIHVILALVNYWSDYGGMEQYVKVSEVPNEWLSFLYLLLPSLSLTQCIYSLYICKVVHGQPHHSKPLRF
jgi:aryl-phospho-beta-D-glucosidase BglC (GH1 family)